MKISHLPLTLFYIALILICSLTVYSQQIIPQPLKINKRNGVFTLRNPVHIYYNTNDNYDVALHVEDRIKKATGYQVELHLHTKPMKETQNGIYLISSPGKSQSYPEGYVLAVDKKTVAVVSNNKKGIFYGVQSLFQLFPAEIMSQTPVNARWNIQCQVIEDNPYFSYRGMHLDVSRHFFPVSFIKQYIDLLAMFKFNTLHWHLVDDQGWRIEIRKYPKLNKISAWREDRSDEAWYTKPAMRRPSISNSPPYGGFYTQEQIREVVAYAARRNITIIPEIEMPGHISCVLAAYPQFSCTPEKKYIVPPAGLFEFSDPYCAGNDSVFIFLQEVLTEIFNLFPSPFIHIGGDEVNKYNWTNCSLCKNRLQTENLGNINELQSYFIKRIGAFINANGRQLIGWDEILEGGVASNAVIMSWRGMQGGIDAARKGNSVIMTPTRPLYFDFPPQFTLGIDLPTNTLSEVYAFNPIPADLDKTQRTLIMGAQANVWTEYMQTPEAVLERILPRMCALSEVLWKYDSKRKFDQFLDRLALFYPRFDIMNVNYHISYPTGLDERRLFFETTLLDLKNTNGTGVIRYTTDGSDPTEKSSQYSKPIVFSETAMIKAATFLPNGKISQITSGLLLKTEYIPSRQLTNISNGVRYFLYPENSHFTGKPYDLGLIDQIRIPAKVDSLTYELKIEGFVNVPFDDIYTFYLNCDESCDLLIDNRSVIKLKQPDQSQERVIQLALKKGYHLIQVNFNGSPGSKNLDVQWESTNFQRQSISASSLFNIE